MTQNRRKYQDLWCLIKDELVVTIQLQPLSITSQQAVKQFKTLKKAISKEKYQDMHYKGANPNSKITYSIDTNLKQVTFTLENDTAITLEDF